MRDRKRLLEAGLDRGVISTSGEFTSALVSVRGIHDRKKGRFIIHGIVLGGLKSVLYRRFLLKMTYDEAKKLRDELDWVLRKYKDTGTEIEAHYEGSDR